ncbi:hypothetical protein QTP88_027839 [Uroleucon formosanum]
MLFEDLPSDDESLSSIDDTDDDETYVPEPNNNILVMESDLESDENVEILNIEENVTYILPSPQKNRSSNRRKNPTIETLADKHGYLWNFDVYTGKSGDTTEKNLSARVVKNLSAPLQNKNYFLYFDNYFTSYPLITYLKLNGIYACGTVNMTRKHLPKFKDDKLFKQGDYDWRIDQFSTSIIRWKDKRMVSLLSNFHDPRNTENVQRRAKDGTVSTIPCPKVLKDYNQNMNCVDKLDQNKKSCQIDRKSHK